MQQIMGSIDQIVRLLCAIGFSGPDCRSNYIWLRRLELSAALDLGQAAEEGDVRAGHGACRVKYSDNHRPWQGQPSPGYCERLQQQDSIPPGHSTPTDHGPNMLRYENC